LWKKRVSLVLRILKSLKFRSYRVNVWISGLKMIWRLVKLKPEFLLKLFDARLSIGLVGTVPPSEYRCQERYK
jgi:hypothetical protein